MGVGEIDSTIEGDIITDDGASFEVGPDNFIESGVAILSSST